MAGKPGRIPEWYRRTPKEFRKELLDWYLGIPRVVVGLVVVLLISAIGIRLKKEPDTSILETLFDNLESIALGSAGIIFLLEIKDRQKRDHYEAWQVINSALGQTGSGGRIQALEDLNRDGVDLEGVDASGADLSGVDLRGANLKRANFRKAQLDGAHLEGAYLERANLENANLVVAHLEGANLWEANLENADLIGAHLENAKLGGAHLENAKLDGANLENAKLGEAHLQGVNLSFAHLEGANLGETHLEGAMFLTTNLRGAQNITPDQVTGETPPLLCNTPLPDEVERELHVSKDRDCDRMADVLQTRYPDWFRTVEKAQAYIDEQRQKIWDEPPTENL